MILTLEDIKGDVEPSIGDIVVYLVFSPQRMLPALRSGTIVASYGSGAWNISGKYIDKEDVLFATDILGHAKLLDRWKKLTI